MSHNSRRPHGSHADSAGSASESPPRSAANREMAGQRGLEPSRSPDTRILDAVSVLQGGA
jgi:hypothetical protein